LFPVFGSGGVPESETVAVFGYAPEALAVTVIAIVAVAPLAKGVGSVHTIGEAEVQVVPALGVTETSVNPVSDQASVRTTLFAADGPLFDTVTV
jgi:hypothetical protein